MKIQLKAMILAALAPLILCAQSASGVGFTESDLIFYGEVRQTGGAGTVLLQSGALELTIVNERDPENRVTLQTALKPTGVGATRPFSYALEVPLAYLPAPQEQSTVLAIGTRESNFKIESITINGAPATLPDGSREFFSLSFANRADQYRLDLLVAGDGTDSDGDGLPDWWEELHGLDALASDAAGDLDSDGWSNLEEFRRGSNPAVSNRDPQLATAEIIIPESGEGGCFLQFHDSDTAAGSISVRIDPAAIDGFDVRWDGSDSPPVETVTLADLQGGRLTFLHTDPAVRELSLPLAWSDGGEEFSGAVMVRVVSPSTEDGNDAALWLAADSFSSAGELVSIWTDRSGNSRDAMQPLEENRPVVVPTGHHRSIQFQDASSHLFFQDAALPTGDHTVLVAYQSEGSPTRPQVLMSSNRGFLRLDPTAEAISYPGAPHYQIDGLAVRGFESTVQAGATSIFRREGSTLQNVFGLSFNGEAVPAETLEPVLPTLGASRAALPGAEPVRDGFRGQLHELLVFPTALPEQKLRDVHDYLESKWGGAVVWDLSTSLRPVVITAAGDGRHIMRGGHGADQLRGGRQDNVISGGPGDDLLTGNEGLDRFVFGGVDTGRDVLVDFDQETDVIDFSALFWGRSGDARQFIATRLETNFSGPIPTLDTVLVLQRPDAAVQEIVLQNVILGDAQLIELIVEGRIRMGALTIPTEVSLALAAGSEDSSNLREDLDESFTVELTRSGDGVAGALDVPLGFFQDALGHDLVAEGTSAQDGQRAVVTFDRGETQKRITIRPVPDLETEGVERWETAVLPQFRYTVSGGPAARSVSDDAMVSLAVLEANALVDGAQAAQVRITRDGALTEPLVVALDLDGSAEEGTHLNRVPRSVTIATGQTSVDVAITTHPGWDGAQPRMALLRLVTGSGYQIGHPHEATIYAGSTASQVDGEGFDRWVSAATAGQFASIHELLQAEGAERVSDYLRAYAFGEASPGTSVHPQVSLRIVGNRPELTTRLQAGLPDLSWQVQDSDDASSWSDVGAEFSEDLTGPGLRLLGPPLAASDSTKLYRLRFDVETTSGLESGLRTLSGSSRYGLRGPSTWTVHPVTGELSGNGGAVGEPSRLIVEVHAPTILDFEMAVADGDGTASLAFYIDGVQVSQTNGTAVRVVQTLDPTGTAILMWEFRPGTGRPVIR